MTLTVFILACTSLVGSLASAERVLSVIVLGLKRNRKVLKLLRKMLSELRENISELKKLFGCLSFEKSYL
jgi:hypothetical protein